MRGIETTVETAQGSRHGFFLAEVEAHPSNDRQNYFCIVSIYYTDLHISFFIRRTP